MDLPDGYGLDFPDSWSRAVAAALSVYLRVPYSGRTTRAGNKSSQVQFQEEKAPPQSFKLPKNLLVVVWLGDLKSSIEPRATEHIRQSVQLGKEILERRLQCEWTSAASIPISVFQRHAPELLPDNIHANEVGDNDANHAASGTFDNSTCSIRSSLGHFLRENQRVSLAKQLIKYSPTESDTEFGKLLGELLIESHDERRLFGLGSTEADQMLDQLMEYGPRRGLYGGRLATLGQNGLGVTVLLERRGLKLLNSLRNRWYFSPEGPWPFIF